MRSLLVTPGSYDEREARPPGRGRREVLSLDDLEEIAAGLARTAPYGRQLWTEGTRRRYAQLVATDLYDGWLIDWSPSSNLELHDHGGSQGAIAVASGALVETYTDRRSRLPLRTRMLDEGATVKIPTNRVHEVYNLGPDQALSVHVYSRPLKSMTFYDPRPLTFLEPLSRAEGDQAALEEATT